jgi:hypothetical protein
MVVLDTQVHYAVQPTDEEIETYQREDVKREKSQRPHVRVFGFLSTSDLSRAEGLRGCCGCCVCHGKGGGDGSHGCGSIARRIGM